MRAGLRRREDGGRCSRGRSSRARCRCCLLPATLPCGYQCCSLSPGCPALLTVLAQLLKLRMAIGFQ